MHNYGRVAIELYNGEKKRFTHLQEACKKQRERERERESVCVLDMEAYHMCTLTWHRDTENHVYKHALFT